MKHSIILGLLFLVTISGQAFSQDIPLGFRATLMGANTGTIQADGVLKCIRPHEAFGEMRPGYFFLADGQGVRDYGITFTLPLSATTGEHTLQAHNPFDVGTIYEARIDIDVPDENRTASYQKLPEGVIVLTSMYSRADMKPVKGTFDFSVENNVGERIHAAGQFHLPVEQINEDIPDVNACYNPRQ